MVDRRGGNRVNDGEEVVEEEEGQGGGRTDGWMDGCWEKKEEMRRKASVVCYIQYTRR